MLRTLTAAGLTAAALIAAGGAAHAQGIGGYGYAGPVGVGAGVGFGGGYGGGYGYDAGVPAYGAGYGYGGGYGYEPYHRRGFTLLGARAGVTVLGVDVDASAKLTVGAHGWGGGRATGYLPPAPQPYAPPQPYYPQPAYEPQYPSYPGQSWSYGCGCQPSYATGYAPQYQGGYPSGYGGGYPGAYQGGYGY